MSTSEYKRQLGGPWKSRRSPAILPVLQLAAKQRGRISAKEVGALLFATASHQDVAQLIAVIRGLGYIELTGDRDGRSFIYRLTPQGQHWMRDQEDRPPQAVIEPAWVMMQEAFLRIARLRMADADADADEVQFASATT